MTTVSDTLPPSFGTGTAGAFFVTDGQALGAVLDANLSPIPIESLGNQGDNISVPLPPRINRAKKAIIAVSRKLLKMIYILLERGQYYDLNYTAKAIE